MYKQLHHWEWNPGLITTATLHPRRSNKYSQIRLLDDKSESEKSNKQETNKQHTVQ